MFDLVIKDAEIHDGAGSAPVHGNLGVTTGKITAVGGTGWRWRPASSTATPTTTRKSPGIPSLIPRRRWASPRRADIAATNVEVDGVAELWFDDQAALEAAARTPEMKALHDDGALFIGRIRSYVVEEKFVIGQ